MRNKCVTHPWDYAIYERSRERGRERDRSSKRPDPSRSLVSGNAYKLSENGSTHMGNPSLSTFRHLLRIYVETIGTRESISSSGNKKGKDSVPESLLCAAVWGTWVSCKSIFDETENSRSRSLFKKRIAGLDILFSTRVHPRMYLP